jgi:putative ABC transport system permease protein
LGVTPIMLFNLSMRNVQKSFRVFAIYFLTLTFSVAVFYTFNSIESQRVMLGISSSQSVILKTITTVTAVLSVFVAVILGFLIIYANHFLIRQRKKELGIYSLLGMNKHTISRILVMEALIIGLFSLASGLFLGVIASQCLSVLTGSMFKTNVAEYTFTFSFMACIRTIICFSIIYLCVILFNSYSIAKHKLIDLLYSARKNEKAPFKSVALSFILFMISIVMMATAYQQSLEKAILTNLDGELSITVLLGAGGTLLFFMSVAGWLLTIMRSNKKLYYKNLNLFTINQIASKIKTNFLSVTMICLMLFVAICILSSGLGINRAITNDLEFSTPFDITINGFKNENALETLQKNGIHLETYTVNYVDYKTYKSNVLYSQFVQEKYKGSLTDTTIQRIQIAKQMSLMKLSDYNKLMAMQKGEQVQLHDTDYLIYTRSKELLPAYTGYMQKVGTLTIGEKHYNPLFREALLRNFSNVESLDQLGTIVLADKFVDDLPVESGTLVVDTNDRFSTAEINDLDAQLQKMNDESGLGLYFMSRELKLASSAGVATLIAFIGIYIGIIFLITSGAVLALQQVNEAADNVVRYDLLRKIGATKSMINRAIFTQIGVYFAAPLGLAAIHSVVGLLISNTFIRKFGNADMATNMIFAAVIIFVIYGAYFLTTFYTSKRIIQENK